jgi:hypothetical protein
MSLENRVDEKIEGQKDHKSIIEAAIARLAEDVGAVFEPLVIEALRAIRNTSPADHQRYRKRINTTWKVSSFAGRQSLRLSGWHQHLQHFIAGFALGKIPLA